MVTQIDDTSYESPATRVKILETVLMTLAIPAIGWGIHAHDPLFLDSGFSWLVIAPLLAGIRYGFVYGFSSALATVGLMIFDGYGWLPPTMQEGQIAVTYAIGVILIGMVAGEVADVWHRRLMRMRVVNTAQATRLEEFVRHYHLLRVSHDQLAERLAATPHTLRDALLELGRQFQHIAPEEDVLQRHAGDILKFLALNGKMEQGALYRVKSDGSLDPAALASFGGMPATPASANHPMLLACLQQRRMMCLKSEMTQSLPDAESGPLAVVPLIDVNERIWAVVAITEMPFIDYHRGQLHLLSVLGANLGDILRKACSRQPDDERTQASQMASELKRWVQYAHRHDLPSVLVTLELPRQLHHESRRHITDLAFNQLRTLDAGWVLPGSNGAQRICILMPLTEEQGARPYCERISQLLLGRYGIDATSVGLTFRHQMIDGKQSANTILGNIARSVSDHVAA